MRKAQGSALAGIAVAFAVLLGGSSIVPAAAGDVVLSGAVKSAAGETMGGVTVSAKAEGQTITTTVFTDDAGNYYFPPLPVGAYRVWAQTLSFETAKAELDLAATRRQDFMLRPITDFERQVRQLPGEMLLAALPEDTERDHQLKIIFRNNCTGCHTPSYPLQFRFDEAGWNAIIDLMKRVNVAGVYQGPDGKPNAILDFNQKDLAAYLARARGPEESSLKIKPRPRPSGDAARAVFTEYDVPLNPDLNLGTKYQINDGSDWTLATTSKWGILTHDAGMDLDGNLWFTSNNPNRVVTIGRVDSKTGGVRFLKVDAANGLAANAHGLVRDPKGMFWFDANIGRRSLGRLDPRTEHIDVFTPPASMSPLGGAVTVDVDGKGKVWASSPDGVLRFDPDTETFTEFKSAVYKSPHGTGMTYGAAGDRDGNGWWAQMAFDVVGKADVASGKPLQVKLPPVIEETKRVTAEARVVYEKFDDLNFNTPVPWSQGPRRMGTDKNADVLWVGDSWGGNLARIDTRTMETTIVPLPDPIAHQPYHIVVDQKHNVWGNLWNTDQIYRYDPAAGTWTFFNLPRRGTEVRHISLSERDGRLQVVLPVYRTSQIAVMSVRSEADLQALKAQAERQ
jgi:streptogramin lyase